MHQVVDLPLEGVELFLQRLALFLHGCVVLITARHLRLQPLEQRTSWGQYIPKDVVVVVWFANGVYTGQLKTGTEDP